MNTVLSTELFDLIKYNDQPGRDAVIYITSKNFEGDALNIYNELGDDVCFYELRVDNWDANLTPWVADAKMKGRAFGGGAKKLLDSITDIVIPVVNKHSDNIYISGYSLAGLFSLWSLFECNYFAGCACCSGSLWYPGWVDYLNCHRISRPSKIYLSVGNREKNSKNEFMRTVEDAYAITMNALNETEHISALFELNEGGHFNDVTERVVKGIRAMKTLSFT